MPFWRAHITQGNLANIVASINNYDITYHCSASGSCPATGYSTNASDYVVDFAGVITEVVVVDEQVFAGAPLFTHFDTSPTSWIPNDPGKNQTSMGVSVSAFGVFQYLPLVLQSAASRMTQGAAGTFDLPLNLVATNPTTEPRAGAVSGNHTIVFTFAEPVTSGTATISAGTAVAGVPTFSGNSMIVPISGVTNQEYVTVSVSSVTSTTGDIGSGSVRIGFLLADVNQNRVVTLGDYVLINNQQAHAVTAANYLEDVNANGIITTADLLIANNNLAKALPAP